MKRLFILTILAVLFPLMASAQLNVGIINPQEVLGGLPETQQVQAELQQYAQERQQEFVDQYSSWIEDVTSYEEQISAGTLTDDQRQQTEQDLAERESELEGLQQRLDTQIQTRQNELFSPIMENVDTAMQEIAEELNLDYVLNSVTSQGDPIVYYASENIHDITAQVIERLTNNQE